MLKRLFKKFGEIDKDYVLTDKHIHTARVEGKSTALDMAKKAKKIGLRHIAFTEHIRADSTYFRQYLKEIDRIRRKIHNIEIYTGFEAKIVNFQGDIDAPDEALKKAEIKIASVHRFPFGRKLYYPWELKKKICQEVELELAIIAINKKKCNVLGHAGGMSLRFYKEFPFIFFKEIISECAKNDVVFELNSSYHELIFKNLRPILKKYNPYISMGSDAHDITGIGRWISVLKRENISA